MSRTPFVLVVTNPTDFHSFAIVEALRRKGVPACMWHGSDFPGRQTASVWLDSPPRQWEALGPELDLFGTQFSSIWMRRPGRVVIPGEIAATDRRFALRECIHFLEGFYRAAGLNAFWVNPLEAARRADIKLEQLRAATRAGFRIPRTLMSNDPRRIREFLRENRECIYKSFFPVSWNAPDRIAVLFSSLVNENDLPDDALLRLTPGIFQCAVRKSHELRITAMGNSLFVAKLDSQDIPSAVVDWRAATEPVRLEPVDLPVPVAQACRSVMRALGIVFGCFDLVVTPSSDYVFLEVNEMGAFLWIEEQNPDFRLADAFCEFLIEASADFQWQRAGVGVRLEDVHGEALRAMQQAAGSHEPSPVETLPDSFLGPP